MKEIQLTQGQVALVDDDDLHIVSGRSWYAWKPKNSHTFYAVSGGPRVNGVHAIPVYMHRLILGLNDRRIIVDHANRIGTDNRRVNLRTCTVSQNIANSPSRFGSSKYKGVRWRPDCKRWSARIVFQKKEINLGGFKSEIDAARAYNEAAIRLFGEFAFLNVLPKEPINGNSTESPATAVGNRPAIGNTAEADGCYF